MLILFACESALPVDSSTLEELTGGDSGVPCPPLLPDCHDSGTDSEEPPEPGACEPLVAPAATAPVGTCTFDPTVPEGVFTMKPGWHWTDARGSDVAGQPVVANLTDDNGDGVVDGLDTPDVVLAAFDGTSNRSASLVVLDGATGTEHWRAGSISRAASLAVGDLDGDGVPEIAATTVERGVVVYSREGRLLWTSEEHADIGTPLVSLVERADAQGLDVMVGELVLDGHTGALLMRLPLTGGGYLALPAVGDLDGDGQREFFVFDGLYGEDGVQRWQVTNDSDRSFAAVINADSDDDGEILVVDRWTVTAFDPSGVTLWTYEAIAEMGPPCIADFDGDGAVDIALAGMDAYVVLSPGGRELTQGLVPRASFQRACSAADLDRDGAAELILRTDEGLILFDPRAGLVLGVLPDFGNAEPLAAPVLDVDGDGHAEILLTGMAGLGLNGLVKVEQEDDAWPWADRSWPNVDFTPSRADASGVRANAGAYWVEGSTFNAQPSLPSLAPDLSVELTDWCVSSCETGTLQLAVQVTNRGQRPSNAGLAWTLYAVADAMAPVASGTLEAIDAGRAAPGFVIELPATSGDLVLVVDDGEVQEPECDETNNVAWFTARPCG